MKRMKTLLIMTGMIAAHFVQATYLIDDGNTLVIFGDWNLGNNSIVMGDVNSGNGLVLNNGAQVVAPEAYFGYSTTSLNNYVEITESAALGLTGALVLGRDSANNTLDITDGGGAYTGLDGIIGYFQHADSNTVTVSGSGSEWIMNGNLYVGFLGSDSGLNILDGGRVLSEEAYVGAENGADNNTVMVFGSGSEWTANNGLSIGDANSTGNMVTVTNGGTVVVYDGLWIDGAGNEFRLQRNGTLKIYSDFDAAMAGFSFNEGAALYVGGLLSNAPPVIEGGRTLGLMSTNGWWNRSGSTIEVGGSSSNNALRIEDGAWVEADELLVGSGTNVTGNTVSVTGDASLLRIANDLSIGAVSNAGNAVEVTSGGTIQLGGTLLLGGAGNTFNLGDGGWLVASNGLDVSTPGFSFGAGGTLDSRGALTGMVPEIEDRRTVLLTGSNAVWNLGTDILHVGSTSSSNALYLQDGARLTSSGAMVGSIGTTGNLAQVSGSTWINAGDLAMDGFYNDLVIADGGYVDVAQSLSVKNASAISFASGGSAAASGYYQDATSILTFDNVTNSPSVPALLVVGGTAEFEAGATVEYTGAISGIDRGTVFTNHLVDADTLVVDGVTNATGGDLDVLNVAGEGTLLNIDLVSENDDLIALIRRLSLAESAGFTDGSDLAAVCDELDTLADGGDPRANYMLDTLSGFDAQVQNRTLSQLYDRHAPSYAHAKGMMDGFKQARMRGVVPGTMLPQGPFGPHYYNAPSEWWAKGYGSWGQRDGSDSFSGYDQSIYGVLIGVDKSFGDVLAGVAGGMAVSDISQDDGDDSESQTGYGLGYASWGTLSWFADLNIGYGHGTVEEDSGTLFNTSAEYDTDQLGFYLGGGKELVYSDERLFITPSAAFSGCYYLQESYVESSTTAVPRRIDDYDYLSLKSALGMKVTYTHDLQRSVVAPEMHANWLHEFNADEERIGYSLMGGTGKYSFAMQAPVEDLFEVGTGLSWWMFNKERKVYEWYAGLEGGFGDGYTEFTASLRLLGQF